MQPLPRYRLHRPHLVAKVIHQLAHIGREVIHLTAALASERPHGALIGARRTAKPQIDAIRIERRQGAELLGDDQRRVVRQHDAARPDAQGIGTAGQMTDQHRSGGAGDARHVVVLGQPVAAIAQAFGMTGQVQRAAKRL